jgi:hypothetical protein
VKQLISPAYFWLKDVELWSVELHVECERDREVFLDVLQAARKIGQVATAGRKESISREKQAENQIAQTVLEQISVTNLLGQILTRESRKRKVGTKCALGFCCLEENIMRRHLFFV